jgi:APA family basic amino acid/polyamine antiporter
MPATPWLPPVAVAGAIFSLWAIWGTGIEAVMWGLVLLLGGAPIYAFMKMRTRASS